MLLRERNFFQTEGGAPLLMQNHYYLQNNADKAFQKTRIWLKLLLNRKPSSLSLEDEKQQFQSNENDQKSNWNLKILEKPDRIIRKDVERTFLTEPKRVLLTTILDALQTAFADYQQTLSYVSGILLLFFDPKTVFEMMFTLGTDPKYNMKGYWRHEAVKQGIDAYVLFEILQKINPSLYAHMNKSNVLPETFIAKWFGGLAVQVMPIEHLIIFWSQFFKHGFRYLFKFTLCLLQTLSPMLLSMDAAHKIYEVLRVERKTQFWRSVENTKNVKTEREKVAIFFTKVLSDANSVGDLYNVDNLDFQREREKAFGIYLRERMLGAAVRVTFQGYVKEEEDDNEFEDCENCDDGFAELFCKVCKIYLCEECHENPTGDHALNHAMRSLEIEDDMVNIN